MKFCSICKKPIEHHNLDKTYRISLGNMVKNKFYGNKTYFYHIDCLKVPHNTQSKKFISLVQ